jgi:hypothetical protein
LTGGTEAEGEASKASKWARNSYGWHVTAGYDLNEFFAVEASYGSYSKKFDLVHATGDAVGTTPSTAATSLKPTSAASSDLTTALSGTTVPSVSATSDGTSVVGSLLGNKYTISDTLMRAGGVLRFPMDALSVHATAGYIIPTTKIKADASGTVTVATVSNSVTSGETVTAANISSATTYTHNFEDPSSKTDAGGLYYGAGAAFEFSDNMSLRLDVLFVNKLYRKIDSTSMTAGTAVTGTASIDNTAVDGVTAAGTTTVSTSVTPKEFTTSLTTKPVTMLATLGVFYNVDADF